MRILSLLIVLLNPAWCLAGVNLDWYESASSSAYLFYWDAESWYGVDSSSSSVAITSSATATLSTTPSPPFGSYSMYSGGFGTSRGASVSVTSGDIIKMSSDVDITMYVYVVSLGSFRVGWQFYDDSSNILQIGSNATDSMYFRAYVGGTINTATVNGLSNSTWYKINATFDPYGSLSLSIDDGTPESVVISGTYSGDDTGTMYFGRQSSNIDAMDIYIDEVIIK